MADLCPHSTCYTHSCSLDGTYRPLLLRLEEDILYLVPQLKTECSIDLKGWVELKRCERHYKVGVHEKSCANGERMQSQYRAKRFYNN